MGVKNAAAGERRVMSQGVEFNRLMLDMRAMQADAMSLPKVTAAPSWRQVKAPLPTCSARPWQGA